MVWKKQTHESFTEDHYTVTIWTYAAPADADASVSGDTGPIFNDRNGSKAGRNGLDLQKCLRWEINKEVTEWMSQTKQE